MKKIDAMTSIFAEHSPSSQSFSAICDRLRNLVRLPDGFLFQQDSGSHVVLVKKEGQQICLYFAENHEETGELTLTGIMSRVDVYNPLLLLGLYTQVMMLALLWKPKPKRLYVAGFGGGRMPLVFHHYFPKLVIDSTETDPVVVTLSEQFFGVRLDDRMRVFVQDAFDFLEDPSLREQYDIILVDCYTSDAAQPNKFATAEFYQLCMTRLAAEGVVVTNIELSDKLLDEKIEVFARAFPYTMQFRNDATNVLFGSAVKISREQMGTGIARLEPVVGDSFPLKTLAAQLQPINVLRPDHH